MAAFIPLFINVGMHLIAGVGAGVAAYQSGASIWGAFFSGLIGGGASAFVPTVASTFAATRSK